ncbi:hypothetical protein [Alloalcanivorax mobilis]|uniref:hypothetical protein n=1 Tax=Alloalcanivorax mobilis TaxID=2019569 RepID=UPI000B5B3832|nr:hypothetical protein [Alloalcanivorax mobilis]ASK33110.1 hypothetical protein CEK62_01285 [Alcanivorax sp. N3-2A]ASK36928.1 hypothetical protein CEK62_21480 [Alcanivorax sp. N3-2A]|tara:strand:- start:39028 stop:39465 length:438 start_codon:yes stop_codon:yes gene_type:complete
MQRWRDLTREANRLFENGRLNDARAQYLNALALARALFDQWHDPDEAVAALVTSHFNLAALYERLGQPALSADYLASVHDYLVLVAADQRSPPGLQYAALRHSSATYRHALAFLRRHRDQQQLHWLVSGHHAHRNALQSGGVSIH